MDWRLLIVLLPIIGAGVWAASNVLPIALKQIDAFLNKS
jgi:photosystem II PsbY protein